MSRKYTLCIVYPLLFYIKYVLIFINQIENIINEGEMSYLCFYMLKNQVENKFNF